jgi:hypothetical protein
MAILLVFVLLVPSGPGKFAFAFPTKVVRRSNAGVIHIKPRHFIDLLLPGAAKPQIVELVAGEPASPHTA